MKKGTRIILIVLELLTLTAVGVGLAFTVLHDGTIKLLFEYSVINAAFAAIIAIFSICFLLFSKKEKEIGGWFWGVKLISVTSSLVLILLAFAFSYPITSPSKVDWNSFVKDGPLYLSVCLPLLSLASFLVASPKKRKANVFAFALLGTIIPVAYIVFILVYRLLIDQTMFDTIALSAKAYLSPVFINNEVLKPEIMYTFYLIGIVLVSYLLSLLLSLDVKKTAIQSESSTVPEEAKTEINSVSLENGNEKENQVDNEEKSEKQCESPMNSDNKQTLKEEDAADEPENKKEEETKETPQKDVDPVKKEKPTSTQATKTSKYGDGARVYHISKQSDGIQWQVKLATGKKPIKLFKTQAEAIDFAKRLTKTQGGSIRIHSVKGRMRKGG